jgi:hypothetical protein
MLGNDLFIKIFRVGYAAWCVCREYYKGKYHCTVDLVFDWFVLATGLY